MPQGQMECKIVVAWAARGCWLLLSGGGALRAVVARNHEPAQRIGMESRGARRFERWAVQGIFTTEARRPQRSCLGDDSTSGNFCWIRGRAPRFRRSLMHPCPQCFRGEFFRRFELIGALEGLGHAEHAFSDVAQKHVVEHEDGCVAELSFHVDLGGESPSAEGR